MVLALLVLNAVVAIFLVQRIARDVRQLAEIELRESDLVTILQAWAEKNVAAPKEAAVTFERSDGAAISAEIHWTNKVNL